MLASGERRHVTQARALSAQEERGLAGATSIGDVPHYTPTRASWLNQVEGWLSILQGQSFTGASFNSVEQLKEHIDAFIETYNEGAEPFVWTKSKVHQRRVKGRRLSDL